MSDGMEPLRGLITSHEDWLMHRVLQYAKERGYAKYTSTLAEAWRISIAGLSEAILSALAAHGTTLELVPDDEAAGSPLLSFAVLEAQRHRARGIRLPMFLGLMKYYRQSYLDLIAQSSRTLPEKEQYHYFVNRVFDRLELSFCGEWCGLTEGEKVQELQGLNRAMTNEKNKYLTIFESIDDPVILFDQENRIDNVNHAAAELLLGMSAPGAVYYVGKLKHQTVPWLKEELTTLTTSGAVESSFDKHVDTPGGIRWFQIRLKRMLDVSEKFSGTVAILNDVTGRKDLEEKLRVLSLTDELTGLYNRRGFLTAAAQQLSMARRLKRGLLLLSADVDHLKQINDTMGHLVGDGVLVDAAGLLRETFRASDIIGRMGGDEFVVLQVEGVDETSEESIVARLAHNLAQQNSAKTGGPSLSISVGIVRCGPDCPFTLDELLAQADKRMYEQKAVRQRAHRKA